MQFFCTGNRTVVIPCGILFRSTHKTLRINGVVITPRGGRSNGNTGTENVPTLRHGHQRVEASETPTPNGDTILVNIRLLTQPKGSLYLVTGFQLSQFQIGTLLKICTASTSTAIVNTYTKESLLTQILFQDGSLTRHSNIPAVSHLLITRTTILVHDDGITLRRIEVCWLYNPTIQLNTLRRCEGEEFALAQLILREFLLKWFVVNQRRQLLADIIAK